jgi:hypothetical protein
MTVIITIHSAIATTKQQKNPKTNSKRIEIILFFPQLVGISLFYRPFLAILCSAIITHINGGIFAFDISQL